MPLKVTNLLYRNMARKILFEVIEHLKIFLITVISAPVPSIPVNFKKFSGSSVADVITLVPDLFAIDKEVQKLL